MKFATYEEFVKYLETNPSEEQAKQAWETVPNNWVVRFLKETQQ